MNRIGKRLQARDVSRWRRNRMEDIGLRAKVCPTCGAIVTVGLRDQSAEQFVNPARMWEEFPETCPQGHSLSASSSTDG